RMLAELDELPVLDDGDRLASELAGGDALDCRRETVQVLEERPVALGQRIERLSVEAEAAQTLGDHPVVLGLVSDLARQREVDVEVGGGDEPARRDLGGLDLVLERDLQEIEDVQVALDLGLERVVGRQAAQPPLVFPVELPDELLGGHAMTPSLSRRGSSWVSVSLVTTRAHRGCQGCVCRASACVVKPSTGAPPASRAANTRS